MAVRLNFRIVELQLVRRETFDMQLETCVLLEGSFVIEAAYMLTTSFYERNIFFYWVDNYTNAPGQSGRKAEIF